MQMQNDIENIQLENDIENMQRETTLKICITLCYRSHDYARRHLIEKFEYY